VIMKGIELPDLIKDVLGQRPPKEIEDTRSVIRHAAVLVPLFHSNGAYHVLLTKRTTRVDAHKGQISFPGGAVDERDTSYKETALREAHEEIGLQPTDVTMLGQADDARTLASNFVIHPFVGLIPYPYPFEINPGEVKKLIEVPFGLFLPRTSQDRIRTVEYEGKTYKSVAYPYDGDVIWGATARIMENLVEILKEKMDLPV
jgi:8-oxo-dGTP pyrophosphatase MutT (NUDIX family)